MQGLCPLVKPEKGEELRELNPAAALSQPRTPVWHAGPSHCSAARPTGQAGSVLRQRARRAHPDAL